MTEDAKDISDLLQEMARRGATVKDANHSEGSALSMAALAETRDAPEFTAWISWSKAI